MAASYSLQSQGATPQSNMSSGSSPVFGAFPGYTPSPTTNSTPTAANSSPSLGTNPGMLPGVNSSSQQKTVTANPDGSSTTVHPATSNPTVLAQQQWLNSQGAGLVEDGIAGPKTSAAIAQYGTESSPIPQSSGSSQPAYDTQTGFLTAYGKSIGDKPTQANDPANAAPVSQQTTAGMISPTTGTNANGSTTSGVYTPPNQGTQGVSQGGLIGNAVAQSQAPSQAYTDAMTKVNQDRQNISDLNKAEAQQTSDINQSGTWTSRALGEEGQANQQNAQTFAGLTNQLAGDTTNLNAANTQQGLQQSALSTALGANAPITGVGYGTQTITPSAVSPTGSSSQYGTGPGAAANVSSIQNYTTQLNNLQAAAPAADAAFSVLNSYAQGINASTPIASGLAQLYGSTAQGSAAVAGFKAQLQAVRNAWDTIEGGGSASAIPDNVTPQQLTQVQQQLKTDVQNKTTGYQQELSSLNGSSGSTGSTNNSTSSSNGSIWNF